MRACLSALLMLIPALSALAGQAPGSAEQPDITLSAHDQFHTADQFSNTVWAINPAYRQAGPRALFPTPYRRA